MLIIVLSRMNSFFSLFDLCFYRQLPMIYLPSPTSSFGRRPLPARHITLFSITLYLFSQIDPHSFRFIPLVKKYLLTNCPPKCHVRRSLVDGRILAFSPFIYSTVRLSVEMTSCMIMTNFYATFSHITSINSHDYS